MNLFYALFIILMSSTALSANLSIVLPQQKQSEVATISIRENKKTSNVKQKFKTKQQKIKKKRRRAIGAIVGGSFLILLGLGSLFLSVFALLTGGGLGGFVGYLGLALAAIVGGSLIIIKGAKNLRNIGERAEPSKNQGTENNGKAVY